MKKLLTYTLFINLFFISISKQLDGMHKEANYLPLHQRFNKIIDTLTRQNFDFPEIFKAHNLDQIKKLLREDNRLQIFFKDTFDNLALEEWTSSSDHFQNHHLIALLRIAYASEDQDYQKITVFLIFALEQFVEQLRKTEISSATKKIIYDDLFSMNHSGEDMCHLAALRGMNVIAQYLLIIIKNSGHISLIDYFDKPQAGVLLISKVFIKLSQPMRTRRSPTHRTEELNKLQEAIHSFYINHNLEIPDEVKPHLHQPPTAPMAITEGATARPSHQEPVADPEQRTIHNPYSIPWRTAEAVVPMVPELTDPNRLYAFYMPLKTIQAKGTIVYLTSNGTLWHYLNIQNQDQNQNQRRNLHFQQRAHPPLQKFTHLPNLLWFFDEVTQCYGYWRGYYNEDRVLVPISSLPPIYLKRCEDHFDIVLS